MTLLQIYHWVCQWKNFENRSKFGEVTDKSIVACFFYDSQCIYMQKNLLWQVAWSKRHFMTPALQLIVPLCYIKFDYNLINVSPCNFSTRLSHLHASYCPFLHFLINVSSAQFDQSALVNTCQIWHKVKIHLHVCFTTKHNTVSNSLHKPNVANKLSFHSNFFMKHGVMLLHCLAGTCTAHNAQLCHTVNQQKAPLTLRGQRGRCRNIKGDLQIFGSFPSPRLRLLFLWVWFFCGSWQTQVVHQIWSR